MADDRVTPELRLWRVLGKLPAITMSRYPGRDATLDEILDVLDEAIEGLHEVLDSYERDRGGAPRVFRGPVVLGPGPSDGCVTRAAYYRMIEGEES